MDTMLADASFVDLLDRFAAPTPTPGAGPAAAATAAVGVALLQMVSALPKTRADEPGERAALNETAARLPPIRTALLAAMDADAAAYDAVIAARKRPASTEAEREARRAAIQAAMRRATDTPLEIVRLAADGLRHASVVGANGHRAASGEIGVATTLLRAGLKGARVCVEINLNFLADEAYKAGVAAELRTLGPA
ncbi:MAG: cyclodeaminase/cyclohydrolase family protein [Acidobacteria bacterium]|nr:cyclodeaminase/cyclohydrolase family protein [Acidobacteriota bacterium]